jgi:hypothetical protein
VEISEEHFVQLQPGVPRDGILREEFGGHLLNEKRREWRELTGRPIILLLCLSTVRMVFKTK